ncbi:hypothetical protein CSPHI_05090 [Corynebacterium sphenisci DSM 44792]|uniref:Holin n=1 Tax=Corynebacterium sphenisci DSM 44792 TaxID=1437874 RepID=A0A1L7CXD1_9CORY|nr:hypothetical protein [Corynebacterium sphenisci]APT90513.1 hypothetical protein CSPHI_05090 [Corynebacterium sphenisci DSM 44792]
MTTRERLTQPWVIRKSIYTIAAIIGLVMVAAGIIDPATVDGWDESIAPLVSLALTLTTGMAATRTHRGSDDPVTIDDVAHAADVAARGAAKGAVDWIAYGPAAAPGAAGGLLDRARADLTRGAGDDHPA